MDQRLKGEMCFLGLFLLQIPQLSEVFKVSDSNKPRKRILRTSDGGSMQPKEKACKTKWNFNYDDELYGTVSKFVEAF